MKVVLGNLTTRAMGFLSQAWVLFIQLHITAETMSISLFCLNLFSISILVLELGTHHGIHRNRNAFGKTKLPVLVINFRCFQCVFNCTILCPYGSNVTQ